MDIYGWLTESLLSSTNYPGPVNRTDGGREGERGSPEHSGREVDKERGSVLGMASEEGNTLHTGQRWRAALEIRPQYSGLQKREHDGFIRVGRLKNDG